MWFVASMVRGLSVDDAIRQLRFCVKGCAPYLLDTILEAQEMAVRDHNVEFKSNLWVGKYWLFILVSKHNLTIDFEFKFTAESFVGKGVVIKGIRRHARLRMGRVEYKYCHYFVRLEEGKPPKDYYGKTVTPEQQLEKWLGEKRKRNIPNSL